MTNNIEENFVQDELQPVDLRELEDLLVDDENIDTSYEPFSREPQYINANRDLIQTLPIDKTTRIVDLACGTSTMTGLMLEKIYGDGNYKSGSEDAANPQRIIGMDLSRESLLHGQQFLAGKGYLVASDPQRVPMAEPHMHTVDLLEGSADCLPLVDDCADFSIMGNAIQLIDNLDGMFSELNRILVPGGRFAFNTSFYAGTYTPGTEHIYVNWMQEALAYIKGRDEILKAAGHPGVKRQRGNAARAFSKPWMSPDDYAAKLEQHGFTIEVSYERTVMLDQRCFETIGAYAGLAMVLLSGYPVKLACVALERAAAPTLEKANMPQVPRYWLEVVARKG